MCRAAQKADFLHHLDVFGGSEFARNLVHQYIRFHKILIRNSKKNESSNAASQTKLCHYYVYYTYNFFMRCLPVVCTIAVYAMRFCL